MNSQLLFMKQLTDFSDVKYKVSQNKFIDCEQKFENDVDLNNHDKLIRTFKQLREKLKQTNKEKISVINTFKQKQEELEHLKAIQTQKSKKIHQLIQSNEQYKQTIEENKRKTTYLKENFHERKKLEDQVSYIKIKMIEQKQEIDELIKQKTKLLQISLDEKMHYEQKIKKMEVKHQGDIVYVQQMETQIHKYKQLCLKAQSSLKKIQIKYDQTLFNNKWKNSGNFQNEILSDQNLQLKENIVFLQNKTKKDKQEKIQFQKKLLQLEESSQLWNIKADTYYNQKKTLQKKIKKMTKKISNAKENTDKMTVDRFNWEQKFLKACLAVQQLISRVKRQLSGDVVNLAKTCEFKLGKLKDQNINSSNSIQKMLKKNASTSKKIILANKIESKMDSDFSNKSPPKINFRNSCLNYHQNKQNKENRQILIDKQNIKHDKTNQQKIKYFKNSNEIENTNQIEIKIVDNIELKIKRQRQEMQKKLRQKILYKKIEVAQSPEKHQLRNQYLLLMN